MIDRAKMEYIVNQNYYLVPRARQGATPKWREEAELLDCNSCGEDCPARSKKERFPPDIGGAGQCWRWAEAQSRFAFRNVDQSVVIIPDEIISRIISSAIANMPNG